MAKSQKIDHAKIITAFVLFVICNSAFASPPPPPPQYVSEIAQALLPNQTVATFDRYADLMSNDIKVTIDGSVIADGKQQWLRIERERLGKVLRRPIAYAEGGVENRDGAFYLNIMVIDQFDDQSDIDPNSSAASEPRYATRAVKYSIGDDRLIHAIDILQSGSFLKAATP